jgi:hypothetical protein
MARLARRPRHRPTAENVRVHVVDGLASLGACVEDHPVAGLGDTFAHCHLPGVSDQIGQETRVGRAKVGNVGVVSASDDQHVHRSLGIYVAKGHRVGVSGHYRRRHLTGGDTAEQALGHGAILTSDPPGGLPTYIVALLRTPRCTTPLV